MPLIHFYTVLLLSIDLLPAVIVEVVVPVVVEIAVVVVIDVKVVVELKETFVVSVMMVESNNHFEISLYFDLIFDHN